MVQMDLFAMDDVETETTAAVEPVAVIEDVKDATPVAVVEETTPAPVNGVKKFSDIVNVRTLGDMRENMQQQISDIDEMDFKTKKQENAMMKQRESLVKQLNILDLLITAEYEGTPYTFDNLERLWNLKHYSMRNLMSVFSVLPLATELHTYGGWQKLGRQVKKGSHSARVINFGQDEDEDGNKRRHVVGFNLFDIMDTEEIPAEDIA